MQAAGNSCYRQCENDAGGNNKKQQQQYSMLTTASEIQVNAKQTRDQVKSTSTSQDQW